MAIKTLRVFQEFTSEGYVPMPPAGNIDYGYTIAGTFPGTTPATFQTDDPDIDVTVTEMTDFYVWIRSHGSEWNINYTRNVRVYPDSPSINNVVMGIIIANFENALPSGGTTGQILAKIDNTDYNAEWIDNYADWTSQLKHEVKASVALTKGQAVYVSSADGTNMIVSKASNASESTSSKTLGLIAQNLSVNGKGFVITEGLLSGLNTSSATIGDVVWLGTDGNLIYGLTNKPVAPAHLVFIGIVTRVNNSNGEIFVKVQNGFELKEIHDVLITSPTNNQGLLYDSASTLWKNADVQLPISLTNTGSSGASTFIGNVLNIPNYTLVGLGGVPTTRTITINGTTYDLSADRTWTLATGTVTSVAATVPTGFAISGSPITTSGTLAITFASGYSLPTDAKQAEWDTAYSNRITSASAPLSIVANVISISQATNSANGYLSSTDWATFNAKQSALSGTGFVKVSGSTVSYDNTSYTPTSRLLTINGTSYDLSADRSWTITPGSGMRNVQTFTATSGQTTFTVTGGYTSGLVDVYVNGARLSTSDFTATNGTSVVLGVGVVTNDIVDIVSYTASLSSGINGSGTTNYISKFTASNVLGNSLLFDNGTNVGIGTATPSAALHVIGTILSSSSVTANSFVKSGGTSSQILAADGSVITAGTNITISGGTISASGGGSISGSGTTNYHAKWTSSSSLSASLIYDNAISIAFYNTANGTGYALEFNNNAAQPRMDIVENGAYTATVKSYNSAAWFANNSANPVILGTSGAERVRVTASGSVGIGTSSPSYTLHVNGSVAGTSAYVNLSDVRFKKNIKPLNDSLSKVLQLNGVSFDWNKDFDESMNLDELNHIGLLAQEVEKIIPQSVFTSSDKNKTKSVAYSDLVPVLIEAIKELNAKIEAK